MFAAAFMVSAVLTAVVRRLSLRFNFTARPREDRYHRGIVPLGGGIAIFWTLAIFMISGIAAVKLVIEPGRIGWLGRDVTIHVAGFLTRIGPIIVLLFSAGLLHLVGLLDDRKRLGPVSKLFFQFVAAIAVAVFADVRVEFFIPSWIITSALSAVWIVFLINAFNFLDNMDGLSAGIAAIASSVLMTAAFLSGQVFIGALGIVFIGSLLGFLIFNFPPAGIFMGDCGSLVVGFFVAVLSLKTTYYKQAQGGGLYPVFMPLIVMAVPLYDFVSVMFLRIRQGKSPFVGDTQHFSHRLKRSGLSDLQTMLTLYLATICTGLGAIFLYQVNLLGAILIFVQTFMIISIIAILETVAGAAEHSRR